MMWRFTHGELPAKKQPKVAVIMIGESHAFCIAKLSRVRTARASLHQ